MNPSKHITFNRESLIISASIVDIDLSFVKKWILWLIYIKLITILLFSVQMRTI